MKNKILINIMFINLKTYFGSSQAIFKLFKYIYPIQSGIIEGVLEEARRLIQMNLKPSCKIKYYAHRTGQINTSWFMVLSK